MVDERGGSVGDDTELINERLIIIDIEDVVNDYNDNNAFQSCVGVHSKNKDLVDKTSVDATENANDDSLTNDSSTINGLANSLDDELVDDGLFNKDSATIDSHEGLNNGVVNGKNLKDFPVPSTHLSQ
ncbi:hypothetical protein NDU88_001480 [Pleurodeles waltl]|uniref:Uncharacterized protein n=1 Tax=Pleurodeles waltl TaxID=8319 RepID=A0AAV7SAY1_PLEWA|nr:hypothetical protein NDU88_001480 [Pleurodeles waltl]